MPTLSIFTTVNKRRSIPVYVCIGAILSGGLWLLLAHRRPTVSDPVYRGRHLSSWLKDFTRNDPNAWGAASDAVRAIGTNGGPLLLREAATPDSALNYRLANFLRRQPIARLQVGPHWSHQAKALQAFYALGTNGALILVQGLTNSDTSIRQGCVGQWEVAKIFPELLFEPLLARLKDPEPQVRARAANALGMLGKNPDRVISALTELLHDQDEWVRSMAALGLGMFGARAKSALPPLLNCLSNCTSSFGYFLTNALNSIGSAATNGQ